MKKYLSVLFVFFLVGHSWAQNIRLETLDSLLLDSNYGEVIHLTDKSDSNDPFHTLRTGSKRAQALLRSGQLQEAKALIDDLAQKVQTLSTNKDFASAIVNTGKGSVYLNEGRNDLALESYQSAIESFNSAGQGASLEAADAIASLGLLYNITGKTEQAEEQLLKALSLREEQLPESHELIAATFNDLGLVYARTNPDKALDYYDKALEIYQTLHGSDHPKIAIANTNLGVTYREMEFYGDAINSLETALDIWEKVYKQAHPSKAFVLSNLGQTYLKMGNIEAAEGYYDRALKMYEASYGKKHPDIASTYNAMGNIKLSKRQYNEALANYQNALQANVASFESSDITTNPSVENCYNGNVLLYSLLFKAEAFEARYLGQTLKFSDLVLSLKSLQKCDTLIENLRKQINNENDKIALGAIANDTYSDGVRIAHSLALNAWKKELYREMAFYFAEKSKAAVLQDAISDSNAKSFAGIPNELLEEEKYLKALTAYCNQQLALKPGADEEQSLRDILFKVNRDYEAFTKNLEEKFPEYYNLKFNSTAPSISQIQNKLDNQTAIVSYFLDEKNMRLYTFKITKNKFNIEDNLVPNDFDKLITGLRNSLFFDELATYKKSATQLSGVLVPRLPGDIQHLVIIPAGRMGVIPFETLLTGSVDKVDGYANFPYLIKKYSIQYEFSAGLILQKSAQSKLTSSPSILLCAPVKFNSNENLNELPGTEEEVNDIARLFSASHLKSDILVNNEADEDQIKSTAIKNYKYLHFATHGIVDEENPELSQIFLNKGKNEDGNLYLGEIYNLELDADLVALSACETGLGKISKGEGVIGLSRALVYAGARSIIVSFWNVADVSTSQLMTDFYTNLLQKNNTNFSAALRQAKLKMIDSGKYNAPYYWAPFVVLGF